MKIITAIIIAIIMLAVSLGTGTVFAQDEGGDGEPIITEPIEEPDELNPACEGVMFHPAIFRIAKRYGTTYEELLTYFCDYEFGVGEIFLMMETINRMSGEVSQEEIFAMRAEEELGWGEIWQGMGLIGRQMDEGDETDQPEEIEDNNQDAANTGDEGPSNNGNKLDSPPGLDKEKNPNAPVSPPGLDKGTNHPGRGRKP